ncbi:MAG TPA: DUF3048 domain-containing protein [Firmicutes bacterium]|nr:DUF3048 domain-containing protein [Candidatus Fermentithermobacillaceae bacterium]
MDQNPKGPGHPEFGYTWNIRRSSVLGLIAIGLVTLAILCIQFTGCTKKEPNVPPAAADPVQGPSQPQEPEEPETPENEPLDGLVFVSIGNNSSARPQSGLSRAAVVFEVPAEGGITRLMAGFDIEIDKIGPVRSARKPLVQIAVGFDTPFAHCGGSEDSFEIIRSNKVKSMCAIYTAGECFWRSGDRDAPDNLYTSTAKAVQGAASRGFSLSSACFYPKGTLSGTPAVEVSYGFSDIVKYPNLVKYQYKDSTYVRFINGQQHLDENEEAVAPKALAFLQVRTTYPKGKLIEVDMDVTGEGKALLFSNGVMCHGRWEKPSLREPLRFYIDETGAGLADGLLWIHLVPDLTQVEVKSVYDE